METGKETCSGKVRVCDSKSGRVNKDNQVVSLSPLLCSENQVKTEVARPNAEHCTIKALAVPELKTPGSETNPVTGKRGCFPHLTPSGE